MKLWSVTLAIALLLCGWSLARPARAEPTVTTPLVVLPERKEVQIFGLIYAARFNYISTPSRFEADSAILPPNGTPAIVMLRVLP